MKLRKFASITEAAEFLERNLAIKSKYMQTTAKEAAAAWQIDFDDYVTNRAWSNALSKKWPKQKGRGGYRPGSGNKPGTPFGKKK